MSTIFPYCLSDIADAFEKRVVDSRLFKEEFRKICEEDAAYDLVKSFIPDAPIESFSHEIAIPLSRKCVAEAVVHVSDNIDSYLSGDAAEIIDVVPLGRVLKCLKTFARRFIYTSPEAQKIEIAGYKIVHGLLNHFGSLLRVPKDEFEHFVKHNAIRKNSDCDIEWRIYNQLSRRMIKSYRHNLRRSDETEWFERCRLVVDYIAGLTDQSALKMYQNAEGISLDH